MTDLIVFTVAFAVSLGLAAFAARAAWSNARVYRLTKMVGPLDLIPIDDRSETTANFPPRRWPHPDDDVPTARLILYTDYAYDKVDLWAGASLTFNVFAGTAAGLALPALIESLQSTPTSMVNQLKPALIALGPLALITTAELSRRRSNHWSDVAGRYRQATIPTEPTTTPAPSNWIRGFLRSFRNR